MKKFEGTKRIGAQGLKTFLVLCTVIFCGGMLCAGCADAAGNTAEAEENAMLICAETGIRKTSELSIGHSVEYENCTLRFSHWGDETKSRELKQAVNAFEENYPGITIEIVRVTTDAAEATTEVSMVWEEALIQQLLNQTAPDINQIEWEWIQEYSPDGTLFHDLYKEHKVIQLGALGQEYLKLCTVAEELQALPAGLSGKVFFFNEMLFAKAGIEIPDTLEELMAAGEIFRTQLGEEYYPLALTTEDRMELLVYYLQSVCGKDWVVDGVLQYYAEDVQKGMEFLLSLEAAHVIPTLHYARSDDSLGRDAGWSSGAYGGVFTDSWDCEKFSDMLPVGNTGVAAGRFMDMGTGRGGFVEVAEAYAVSESCAYKKEAALFLEFLLNGEVTTAGGAAKGDEGGKSERDSANGIALESSFFMNYDYACMVREESLYGDVIAGLSYGDYNAREAAQLLLDSFGN